MSSQVIGNQLVFTFACGTVVRLKLEPEPTCSLNPSIDVLELMRATLLCCNRTFQEQGIARLICGFHKDLIGESVALRIRAIQRETMRWPDLSLEESEGFATEIVQYVRLYASNAKVMSSTLYAPHMIHMEDTLAMAVLNQVWGIFVASALLHIEYVGTPLIRMLHTCLVDGVSKRGDHPHD
ncbi:hypothetical protein MPSEU_000194000 [Mayamaea pseudoterrestris]|nr:hypothetical protein MPSEU_000194000 [Mayamaea pseudoterrestris]